MKYLGVIEGFFGPKWSENARESYATFLKLNGGSFYIYAPKQDAMLRKRWRDSWSPDYLLKLEKLKSHFYENKIKFGVGLSPFGLKDKLTNQDISDLDFKLNDLNKLGIDILGIFFDDMPVSESLARFQVDFSIEVQKRFKGKILFCPSYYSPDPILDKVFGKRPDDYLNQISSWLPLEISILWTGPKVISPELSDQHLLETKITLGRKPFIWDNLFANDGPKNCKYLKIIPFNGRGSNTLSLVDGYGLNMMNQPELSKILFLSAKNVFEGMHPEAAFEKALNHLSMEFAEFIKTNQELFVNIGLDQIPPETKLELVEQLSKFTDVGAREMESWLRGEYVVDSECLTD